MSKKGRCRTYTLSELGIDPGKLSKAGVNTVSTLKKGGHKAYLVGGAVRDLLIGLEPKDYDVNTDATPEQIKSLFRRAFIIGKRFRLVHVRQGREIVEVSTFRKKPQGGTLRGNKHIVSDNTYGSAEQDAFRRDMTVNALMLDPVDRVVLDYTGGIEDIKKRSMRVIGNPRERFEEDPVRIMRMLRLAAKLGFKISKPSLDAAPKMAGKLSMIPSARLFDEFTKATFSTSASTIFTSYLENNVAQNLFPHCASYTENETSFIDGALHRTDQLERRGQHGSLSFVVSAIYWPSVSARWNEACDQGKAGMNLMRELYLGCGIEESPIVPKNLRYKVWEMWEYQSRFQKLARKKKALRIGPSTYATRKAVAFLRYRNEHGEIGPELPDWWEPFIEMDAPEREAMLSQDSAKRRRRRKRPGAADAGAGG